MNDRSPGRLLTGLFGIAAILLFLGGAEVGAVLVQALGGPDWVGYVGGAVLGFLAAARLLRWHFTVSGEAERP